MIMHKERYLSYFGVLVGEIDVFFASDVAKLLSIGSKNKYIMFRLIYIIMCHCVAFVF